MAKECCAGLLNYGKNAPCIVTLTEGVYVIIQSTFDSNGNRNYIDLTAPFGQTEVDNLLLNTDEKKRWIVLPKFSSLKRPIADTVFDEEEDGTKTWTRDGIWSLTGMILQKSAVPSVLKKLKALRCNDIQVYIVSKTNQLDGAVSEDGTKLYGYRLNAGSVDPKMMFAENSVSGKISFAVDFDNTEKQENTYALVGKDLTTPVDFLNLKQLTDVNLVVSASTTTTLTFIAKTDYFSGLANEGDVVGRTGVDFALLNKTTGLPVTLTTVVEDATIDGKYVATFPAVTATNVVELSMVYASGFAGSVEKTI
jgi:hypothetical protein